MTPDQVKELLENVHMITVVVSLILSFVAAIVILKIFE